MSFFPLAITGMGLACRRTASEKTRFIVADGVASRPGESRVLGLALEAAGLALGDESLPKCGVCVTVSKGWLEELERGDGTRCVLDCAPDFAARRIVEKHKLSGPCAAAVAACASGLASVKVGADWIRDGVCESVLAGAAESSNSEMVLRSFERLGVISAAGATRPFDESRDGFVVGEGAGVFRIEALGRNRSPVLGRILSIALGADAHHLTTPEASGSALAEVIGRALELAEVETVGWVHAHGTGTVYNDRVEAAALRRVFGKNIPPVTATKGMSGHLLGASGAVALGLTVEHLRAGTIPGVVGLVRPAAEFADLDLVVGAERRTRARTALVLNHGFGGHIAAAVVGV